MRISLYILAIILCVSCSMIKPQVGGKSVYTNGKEKITLQQNENSAEPSEITFSRVYIPSNTVGKVFCETNGEIIIERYSSKLGTHQVDKARHSFLDVKKLQSLNKLYYFGCFFILLGIAAIALKGYLPFLGIKVPILCIGIGIMLCMLPSALSDTSMKYAIFGVCVVLAFAMAKKYNTNTSSETKIQMSETNNETKGN